MQVMWAQAEPHPSAALGAVSGGGECGQKQEWTHW